MNPGPRTVSEKDYGSALKQAAHVRAGKAFRSKFNLTNQVTDTVRQRVSADISEFEDESLF